MTYNVFGGTLNLSQPQPTDWVLPGNLRGVLAAVGFEGCGFRLL